MTWVELTNLDTTGLFLQTRSDTCKWMKAVSAPDHQNFHGTPWSWNLLPDTWGVWMELYCYEKFEKFFKHTLSAAAQLTNATPAAALLSSTLSLASKHSSNEKKKKFSSLNSGPPLHLLRKINLNISPECSQNGFVESTGYCQIPPR